MIHCVLKAGCRHAVVALLAVTAFLYVTGGSPIAREAGAGLDRGTFDVLQSGPLPTAWIWVEDDTIDGDGVEYWALHGSFVHPGPQNPSVSMSIEHQAGVNHQTLQDFLAWVVANNPHVNSVAELQVHRRAVTPVP